MQNLSSKNVEGEHRQEGQSGSQDSSAQGLVDRLIHDLRQALTTEQLQVLANTVEHDDSVVHRVTDQRQDRRNDRQRDLHVQQ